MRSGVSAAAHRCGARSLAARQRRSVADTNGIKPDAAHLRVRAACGLAGWDGLSLGESQITSFSASFRRKGDIFF